MAVPAVDPLGSLTLLAIVLGWLCWKSARGFVRLYDYLNDLPPREEKRTSMSRHPLRVAASVVGALTAALSGLVGSGLFTADQGNAATGLVTAALTLLATFGVVITTEKKVTPLIDPRDHDGQPLAPAPAEQTTKPQDWGTFGA